MVASRCPTDRALSCAPPVEGDDTSGGRPANRPRVRPPDGWRAGQAERRRRVSCSALLGGMLSDVAPPGTLEASLNIWKDSLLQRQRSLGVKSDECREKVEEGFDRGGLPFGPHAVVERELVREDEDAEIRDPDPMAPNALEHDMKRFGLTRDDQGGRVRHRVERELPVRGNRPERRILGQHLVSALEEKGVATGRRFRIRVIDAYLR